jgi:hypothetical protein
MQYRALSVKRKEGRTVNIPTQTSGIEFRWMIAALQRNISCPNSVETPQEYRTTYAAFLSMKGWKNPDITPHPIMTMIPPDSFPA